MVLVDKKAEDLPPYAVHETFFGGILGKVVSRHATFDEALTVATERADRSRAIVSNLQIVWPIS